MLWFCYTSEIIVFDHSRNFSLELTYKQAIYLFATPLMLLPRQVSLLHACMLSMSESSLEKVQLSLVEWICIMKMLFYFLLQISPWNNFTSLDKYLERYNKILEYNENYKFSRAENTQKCKECFCLFSTKIYIIIDLLLAVFTVNKVFLAGFI